MRRAIVYFFWGQSSLEEATRSANRAAFLGLPRIAVTDRETAPLIPNDAPFEERMIVQPREYSFLAKADLYCHLPQSYDSFLYLDTDAFIIEDISYGFEKSEKYGIAACMAPHYSLDHFFGFDQILKAEGIGCRSQLQYNAGVIFFSRRPDVDAVMQKWSELAFDLGLRHNHHHDQPFLTLAMELLDFNPFTLSPAYNYRDFGELASGIIRIWHSHAPVPESLNEFETAWPPRRFRGGKPIAL